ncbi:MAG: HAD hydrolase-like protein [Anaerolineae bacterium]|nr:HAD hydrolase-like protein [Anaerolineae bacterium]
MKYSLVIFDFDGTLADTFSWFVGIANQIADKYGIRHIDEREYEMLKGYDVRKVIEYLEVPLWKVPLIAAYTRGLMTENIHQVGLFDGIGGVLRQLSEQGATLAVVSSNSSENVRRVLGPESAALIHYYECSVPMFGKPSRFKKILSKSGISHDDAIYIGDEIRDLKATKKVAIAFGAVSWGYNSADSLRAHGPTELFTRVEEIAERLI